MFERIPSFRLHRIIRDAIYEDMVWKMECITIRWNVWYINIICLLCQYTIPREIRGRSHFTYYIAYVVPNYTTICLSEQGNLTHPCILDPIPLSTICIIAFCKDVKNDVPGCGLVKNDISTYSRFSSWGVVALVPLLLQWVSYEDTFLRLRVKLLTLLVGDVHVRYRAEYPDVR